MAPESHSEVVEYAAGHSESAAFPPFDPTYFASQLFWLAIVFGVLYVLLSRWILPRIGSAIEERRDRIADDLDAAAQMKAQADEAVRQYEKSLSDARARSHALAATAKAEMDKKIAAETRKVDAELAVEQDEADARIRASRDKALGELQTIAASTAAAVAAHLAGLEVSEADAAAAVSKAGE